MSGDVSTFVSGLGLTSSAIWGTLGTIAPLVGSLTLIALAIYFVRRAIKKASKGKGGF